MDTRLKDRIAIITGKNLVERILELAASGDHSRIDHFEDLEMQNSLALPTAVVRFEDTC